jgi:hypothetical protein
MVQRSIVFALELVRATHLIVLTSSPLSLAYFVCGSTYSFIRMKYPLFFSRFSVCCDCCREELLKRFGGIFRGAQQISVLTRIAFCEFNPSIVDKYC